MRVLCLFRRRVDAGADRPDRLVSDCQPLRLPAIQALQAPDKLTVENRFRSPGLPLIRRFTDAQNWVEAGIQRRVHLAIDERVGFAKPMPPFAVADDDVAATDILNHGRADFAGEGPFVGRVNVLCAERNGAAPEGFADHIQVRKRRTDGDANAGPPRAAFDDGGGELAAGLRGREHLPVAGDELGAGHDLRAS